MFYQSFRSPQMKRNVTIVNHKGIYELFLGLPND